MFPYSTTAILRRDEEILKLAIARKAAREVASDVADDRLIDDRHVCSARREGLLRVVFSLQIGRHTLIRLAGGGIREPSASHIGYICG